MSSLWSLYIAIFSIVNVVACLWLLWWTSKQRSTGKQDVAAQTTGHEWDGISEYNTPLPKWWLNLFYLTIAFGFVYFALYPALGNFAGTQGWSSAKQHDADANAADARIRPLFEAFANKPMQALMHDPDAQRLGRSVFANHCATCHGSDARGAKGFPNLTDQDWLWGGAPDTVLATVLEGRQAAMPGLEAVIGSAAVPAVTVYVQSLSGMAADAQLAAKGEQPFKNICAACHGAEGRGNPLLGAPNLTDNIWLYGADFDSIAQSIRVGRNGVMPAHRDLIGEERVRVAAAWVLAQSQFPATGQGSK
jgi:cytochrome c oxidase cbb3-type subunit III